METFQNDNKNVNSGAESKLHTSLLWNYTLQHFKQIAIIIVFTIMSLILIVVTIIILTSNKSSIPIFPPGTSSTPPSATANPNGIIRIYSREEWSALPPKPGTINPDLKLPVKMVIIAHTNDEANCTTTKTCLRYVRNLQNYMMVHAFPPFNDIPYNFLVGGDGNAYEGRGWFKKGAHTGDINNNRSIGIGFIGSFMDQEPPQQQLRIAQLLIEEGVYLRHISPSYKLYGACQLRDSDSPGKALYNIITKWPHWSEEIIHS